MESKIALQIYTGGFDFSETTEEEVITKLKSIKNIANVSKIIMGWAVSNDMYAEVINYLHDQNIAVYLWLPVFSEISKFKNVKEVIDYNGNSIKSYKLKPNEKFDFYCPSSEENLNAFIQVLDEKYGDLNFDGIFLDKIRYPSFANGNQAIFTCFCENCKKIYSENNINIDVLKEEIDLVYSSKENSCNMLNHGEIKKFIDIKNNILNESISKICQILKSKGYKVGIDTFTPTEAHYVGQDINKLVKNVDFIKPMFYRHVNAPAGMKFEVELAKKALHLDKLDSKKFISEDFIKSEINSLNESVSKLYAGIEYCYIDGVSEVSPKEIKETVDILHKSGVKKFVLSWDLMSAPLANIDFAIDYINKRSKE